MFTYIPLWQPQNMYMFHNKRGQKEQKCRKRYSPEPVPTWPIWVLQLLGNKQQSFKSSWCHIKHFYIFIFYYLFSALYHTMSRVDSTMVASHMLSALDTDWSESTQDKWASSAEPDHNWPTRVSTTACCCSQLHCWDSASRHEKMQGQNDRFGFWLIPKWSTSQ